MDLSACHVDLLTRANTFWTAFCRRGYFRRRRYFLSPWILSKDPQRGYFRRRLFRHRVSHMLVQPSAVQLQPRRTTLKGTTEQDPDSKKCSTCSRRQPSLNFDGAFSPSLPLFTYLCVCRQCHLQRLPPQAAKVRAETQPQNRQPRGRE